MNSTTMISNNADVKEKSLILPQQLKEKYPCSSALKAQIDTHRQTILNILSRHDQRLMVVVGPCSIHDPVSALEYAEKLAKLQLQVQDQLFLVMRAYIEKPRTTVGWKGLLYDPNLDDTCDMQAGLEKSRMLYLQILEMGLPIASEILNPLATGYFDDLLAWGAIGARTSESQIHREIASHMPYAMGFKNGTDGSIQIALDAIQSAHHAHQFLAMNQSGQPAMVTSVGNPHAHLILRGANKGPNYSLADIEAIRVQHQGKMPALVVDCSHGNSGKDPLKQPQILKQIIAEREDTDIRGVMLESHLCEGSQKISADLQYGQSVTDGCLGWENTASLLMTIAEQLR